MPDYHATALAFLEEEVARVAPVRAGRRPGDEVSKIARAVTDAEASFDRAAIVRAYDGMAALYSTHILADPRSYAEHLIVVCEQIERLRPTRVIDAGCGVGIGTAFLARVFPGTSFAGYDISPVAIADARARAEHHRLSNLRLHVARHKDAAEVYGHGSADFVFARGSIGYLSSDLPSLGNAPDPQGEITLRLRMGDPVLTEWYIQMKGVADLVRRGGAILDIHISYDPAVILRHFLYRQLGFIPRVEDRRRLIEGGAFRLLDRKNPLWRQLIPLPEETTQFLESRSEIVNLYTR